VGYALAAVELGIMGKFEDAGWLRKNLACRRLSAVTVDPGRYPHVFAFVNAWDVYEFFNTKNLMNPPGCATGECKGTVWLYGGCRTPNTLNYIMWGWVNRLCRDFCALLFLGPMSPLWRCYRAMHARDSMLGALWLYGKAMRHAPEYMERAEEWALHGYEFAAPPAPDRPECADCLKDYQEPLHGYWIHMGWTPKDPFR